MHSIFLLYIQEQLRFWSITRNYKFCLLTHLLYKIWRKKRCITFENHYYLMNKFIRLHKMELTQTPYINSF